MTTASAPSPTQRRRRAAVWITIGIVVALIIAFFVFAGLYADILWFQQVGYLPVLTTQWVASAVMFLIGFLAMAVPLFAVIQVAYRLRPMYAKLNAQLDRYQQVIEPLRRLGMWGIPIVFGFFAGFVTGGRWQLVLLYLNRTESGTKDPEFHLDTSFYLFDLPFFRSLVGFGLTAVFIALIASVATCYLYGALRITGREVRMTRAARIQVAVVAGIYFLLQGVSIWLDRYATLTDSAVGGRINGAAYTAVHATIPGRTILAGIAVFVALLFLVTAILGSWRLPVVGTALLIVSAIILGGIFPWGVQSLQVNPSEKTLEAPYLKRGIAATRAAYGVDGVAVSSYNAKTDAKAGALRSDADTAASIRILDPAVVSSAFQQLQQFKQYYNFPDTLDVDRYSIGGKEQDAVVSVRELNQSGLGTRNWYNDTLVYTHGYGIVAAYGNKRAADGQPEFFESGIPTSGKLGKYQPRVYFGESSPTYSIVGGPKGTKPVELDYPSAADSQRTTTFTGDGGPKLSSLFTRLVYALKFQDGQILLSNGVNSDSQILYDRKPLQRVAKVAPYLSLDTDPYPSVVNGRIVWIVDGYTTSDQYPYSQQKSLSDTIANSDVQRPVYATDQINYIRNSVKATVDAYSGKVTLYSWDNTDPILKTWEKVFPSTVKPMSDMSADLISHVRYPTDLFKMQRSVLATYHVTDPGQYFSSEDAWKLPDDPKTQASQGTRQPPYYLSLKMPGQTSARYSLYSTYIPQATTSATRSVLKGYLAVDSNAGATKGVKAKDYGKLRLLTIPSQDNVSGPGQVQNQFESDSTVSSFLNLLRQGNTEVVYGNLLTLPVGGGLLYVEPVYVKSKGTTSYPLLQKVLVSFGDKIAFQDTLNQALDTLFGGNSGAQAGDSGAAVGQNGGTTPKPGGTTNPGGSSTANNAALQAALADARTAIAARDTALKAGDWQAYGKADAQLQDALSRALVAEGGKPLPGAASGSGSSLSGSASSGG